MATKLQNTQAKSGKNKFLPHFIIIGIFLLVSAAFTKPATFDGKVMSQGDYFTWRQMARQSIDYYDQHGKANLWMNNAFSGLPSIMTSVQTKSNWYGSLSRTLFLGSNDHPANPIGYFFWAMVCFYILMMALNVNKWLALIGAIAFAFSSYNPIIITAGHSTKMVNIAYLPALLAGILWVYNGKYWLGGVVTGLFVALFLAPGHYQIIYYGLIVFFVIAIAKFVESFKKKELKQWLIASGIILAISSIGALTKVVHILPTQAYNPHSIRGGNSELSGQLHDKSGGLNKDYAFQWSNGVGETFCLLVPNLYGGASGENIGTDSEYGKTLSSLGVPMGQVQQMTANSPLYWGPQPFLSGPIYFGAIICLLTVLGLFLIRSPLKWWLLGLSIFFILLSTGKNLSMFNNLMFDYFPFLNKFRTPSMALSIPSLLFPMLAIWGLNEFFKGEIKTDEVVKKLKMSIYIIGGLLVVILLATYTMMDFRGAADAQILQMGGEDQSIGQRLLNAIISDRATAARKDTFRSIVLVALSFGLLWAFTKDKLKKELVIAGLVVLVGFDGITVANRYLNESHFMDKYVYDQQYQPRQVDLDIMKDTDPAYRVYDLTRSSFNDSKTGYFHNSIGGYHPAKLEIYQELIENHISSLNSSVINMLNTKYLVVPGANNEPRVQMNPDACGPAWFVSDVKWVNDAREAMDALNAPSLSNPVPDTTGMAFQPLQTAILRDSLKYRFDNFNFGKAENAAISVKYYSPDTIIYQTNNSENGLAVFSEVFYKGGWKATIDGKEAPILRTNYVLRALQIPAGNHEVVFTFDMPSFRTGEKISYAGSALLTLLILAGSGFMFMKYRKEGEEKTEEVSKAKK